jgi:hypothetical protein
VGRLTVRGWSALLHQTALKLLAEVEHLDPNNAVAAMARAIFEASADEGIKPSGAPPGGELQTIRATRAKRAAEQRVEWRKAADLYLTGLSLLDVGKALGHSPAWVSNALLRCRVPSRPKGPHGGPRDPARIERIRQARAEGKTLEQIGAAEHISRERVRQICAAAGVDTAPSHQLTDDQQQAVTEYLGGASLEFVAEKHQVGTTAVRNWVLRAGHEPRPRRRRVAAKTKAAAAKVAKLYDQGLKAREIAEAVGLHDPTMVYRLLAIAGVRPSRNSGAGSQRRLS